MDNKRKSLAAADADDRAAKRRKVPQQQYDLFQGESKESTTQYGLHFLEQIRRTSDKSGRPVAGHFEKLIPRHGNEDYYQRTRMLISLDTIEQKLYDRYFNDMSELESYVKRMVQNAKDYYPRNSQMFEDAERVRKATSNYMVKTNPAYKLVPGYSAVPTPLPESDDEPIGETEHMDEDVDAEGEEDEEDMGDDDAEGGEEEEEDGEGDSDDDGPQARRRGPGRPPRNLALHTQLQASEGPLSGSSKPDHEYEDLSYQGLSFQQAQEKIVEELVRKPDEDDDGYAYFDPFLNLPPRTLKDYYQVIKEPLSLKKLQKLVKGIHGRGERSGVTEYKTWAAFEEKASLLWQNAYYYNEDGSEIANMAKELEQSFIEQLNAAKAAVPEPVPPKIKIKMAPGQEMPVGPKKITIHVANTRGSSADSPVPQTTGSVSSDGAPNGTMARNPFSGQHAAPQVHLSQLEKARSMSGPAPSPSPSLIMKREELARQSPMNGPRPNGLPPSGYNMPGAVGIPGLGTDPYPAGPLLNGHHQPPVAVPAVPAVPAVTYDQKRRLPGKGVADALVRNVSLRTHPSIMGDPERRFRFQVPAHPKLAQQSVAIHIPANHWRQQIMLSLHPSILETQRGWKLLVIVNGITLGPAVPAANDPIENGAMLFEGSLHPGVNTIEIHLIAGVPKAQRLPNGPDAELEIITIHANVMKH